MKKQLTKRLELQEFNNILSSYFEEGRDFT
jgi:hypothetical protein